jgi:hypothetical protein
LLPDRIHLARVNELRFEQLAVGHVHQGAGELDRIAGRVAQQNGLVQEVLVVAAGGVPAVLDGISAAAPAMLQGFEHAVPILVVQTIRPKVRLLVQAAQREPGHRLEIGAHEGGPSRFAFQRLQIEHDRQ